MIGKQARQKGFNVLLAGGANLCATRATAATSNMSARTRCLRACRRPPSGHPGQRIALDHQAFRAQRPGDRAAGLDARIGEAAFRESDLLAFEIAIEDGRPGAR